MWFYGMVWKNIGCYHIGCYGKMIPNWITFDMIYVVIITYNMITNNIIMPVFNTMGIQFTRIKWDTLFTPFTSVLRGFLCFMVYLSINPVKPPYTQKCPFYHVILSIFWRGFYNIWKIPGKCPFYGGFRFLVWVFSLL